MAKILASHRGFSGSRYLTAVLEFKKTTLVAIATKIWELWHKISYECVYMDKNFASNRVRSWLHNLTASIKFTKDRHMLLW